MMSRNVNPMMGPVGPPMARHPVRAALIAVFVFAVVAVIISIMLGA